MRISIFNKIFLKFIVTLLIPLFSCSIEYQQGQCQMQDLKGSNVKLVKETSYLLKNTEKAFKVERKARRISDNDDFIASFDNDGKLSQKVYYDSKGNELYRWIFTYNMKGQCSRQKIFNKNEELFKIIDIEYDKKRNKIKKIEMDNDEVIIKKYLYEYDNYKRLVKETVYYPTGGEAYFREFYYDRNGKLIEDHWFSNEKHLYKKVKYTYNEEKFKSSEIIHLIDLNEVYTHWKYEYVYDSHGNWTSRIDYLDEIPRYQLKRVIDYE